MRAARALALFGCAARAGAGPQPTPCVSTIAGGASALVTDAPSATAAKVAFTRPSSFARDERGALFFTSLSDVLTVLGDGSLASVAGVGIRSEYSIAEPFADGTALGKPLGNTKGVDYDARRGVFYLADNSNDIILSLNLSSGELARIAGSPNNIPGFSGDGSVALNASLRLPLTLGIIPTRDVLLIADSGNCRVRAINLVSRLMTTFAGNGTCVSGGDGGPALSAAFILPTGLAIDDAGGRVFVSDYTANNVRVITADGSFVAPIAGNGARSPLGAGDGGPALRATLYAPAGLAIDVGGRRLFIAEELGNGIRVVDLVTGLITSIIPPATTGGYSGNGGPPSRARINNPFGLFFEPTSGDLIIGDYLNDAVRVVRRGGNIEDFFMPVAEAAANASSAVALPQSALFGYQLSLSSPQGIAPDCVTGVFYFTDNGNHIVYSLGRDGIAVVVAGSQGVAGYSGDDGPARAALLRLPGQAAFSPLTRMLFFADIGNFAVRAINVGSGVITTVAGNGTRGFNGPVNGALGDGGPATAALLGNLNALALDDAGGRLFIGQSGDQPLGGCIRMLAIATGRLTTIAGACDGTPVLSTAPSLPTLDVALTGPLLGAAVTLNASDPAACAALCAATARCKAWSAQSSACAGVAPGTSLCALLSTYGTRVLRPCASSGTASGASLSGDGGRAATSRFSAITSLAWDAGASSLYVASSVLANPFGDRVDMPPRVITGLSVGNEASATTYSNGINADPSLLVVGSNATGKPWRLFKNVVLGSLNAATTRGMWIDGRTLFFGNSGGILYTVDLSTPGLIVTPLTKVDTINSFTGDGENDLSKVVFFGPRQIATDCAAGIVVLDSFANRVRQMINVRVTAPGAAPESACAVGFSCECGRRPVECTNTSEFCGGTAAKTPVSPGYKAVVGVGALGAAWRPTLVAQAACAAGVYCAGGVVRPCPVGSAGTLARQFSASSCLAAAPGRFQPLLAQAVLPGARIGAPCPPGYFAAAAGTAFCSPCAANTASSVAGATSAAACAPCAAATSFAPPGASVCAPRAAVDVVDVKNAALIVARDAALDAGNRPYLALALLYAVPVLATSAVPLVLLLLGKALPARLVNLLVQLDLNPMLTDVPTGGHPVVDPNAPGGAFAIFFVGAFLSAAVAQALAFLYANTLVVTALLPFSIDAFAFAASLPAAAAAASLLPSIRASSGITVVVDVTGAACAQLKGASIVAYAGNLSVVSAVDAATTLARHVAYCADCLPSSISSISFALDASCTAAVVTVLATGAWGRLTLVSIPVPDVASASVSVPVTLQVLLDGVNGSAVPGAPDLFTGGRSARGFMLRPASLESDPTPSGGDALVRVRLPLDDTHTRAVFTSNVTLIGLLSSVAGLLSIIGFSAVAKGLYRKALTLVGRRNAGGEPVEVGKPGNVGSEPPGKPGNFSSDNPLFTRAHAVVGVVAAAPVALGGGAAPAPSSSLLLWARAHCNLPPGWEWRGGGGSKLVELAGPGGSAASVALAAEARTAASVSWAREELPPGWNWGREIVSDELVFCTPAGVTTRDDPRDDFERYALAFAAAAARGVDVRAAVTVE